MLCTGDFFVRLEDETTMKKIPEVTQEMLNKYFHANVEPFFRRYVDIKELSQFTDDENKQIEGLLDNRFSILGIDIYQYSLFPPEKLMFVPFVFLKVYEYSARLLKDNFSFLFQKVDKKWFHDKFIDTGDGGFLILETPLHSVVFGLILETVFRLYNSYHFLPMLREKVGSVTPRYAITYDNIYSLGDNYFGAAIINNARLLHKDKLNRLLIESHTYDWFMIAITGVENLQVLCLKELMNLSDFSDYEAHFDNVTNALIPTGKNESRQEGIKSVDIQKIGPIKEKSTELDVYNLHIQAIIEFQKVFQDAITFTVSLGNLNTSGISDG